MGHLVNRVDVDKVPFHFMPPAFADRCPRTDGDDPDLHCMENVYAFCHEWVFRAKPRGNFLKHRDIILKRVGEAGTSIKLFFLANMLSWRQSHGETAFYPSAMTGEPAVNSVRTFAKTCEERYGTFDILALDRLMGSDVAKQDFETHLLNSEITAGTWIITYKMLHTGGMAKRLYFEQETALNPYWLAVEPTYYDTILEPYRRLKTECSGLLRKHRWNTTQVIGKLKRNSKRAISVFGARERIMPIAIRRVLEKRGLRAEYFQMENIPVIEPLKFWSRLGNAIAHYEFLNFVDNYPSAFDQH